MIKIFFLNAILFFLVNSNANAQCETNYQGCVINFSPLEVNFEGNPSGSTTGINSYTWDFGDGQTGTGQNITHTYSAQGTYQICLMIATNVGCIDTTCIGLYFIQPAPNLTGYLWPQSGTIYRCSAPDTVSYLFSGIVSDYNINDSVLFHFTYGDGTDTSYYELLGPCLGNQFISAYFIHTFQNPGTYNSQLTVTTSGGITASFSSTDIVIGSSCGNISGKAYADNNTNCIFDSGDSLLANTPIYILQHPLTTFTLTDSVGNYSFNTIAGMNYTISGQGSASRMTANCPAGGSYTNVSSPASGIDFGFNCEPDFDLEVNVFSTLVKTGFQSFANINARNRLCHTPNGTIQIIFPSDLTPLPDSLNTYTIAGNTVTYFFIDTISEWNFKIPLAIDPTVTIGTIECISAVISPLIGDLDTINNYNTYCATVRSSFDPNDKHVSPEGVGPLGKIQPNTDLTYTVNFQNTGNASAVNIFILDTISTNLDITSLEVLGSSHQMTWTVLANNVVRFQFDDIYLPDSNSNEPLSHGLVQYRISQNANLPNLSTINNTANIYFDYNAPIITNMVSNTIDNTIDISEIDKNLEYFTLLPNPANESIDIRFSESGNHKIKVTDILGKIILEKTTNENSLTINSSQLPNGIYFVFEFNSKNQIFTQKLIIVH